MADTRKYKILHPAIHIVGGSQLITVGLSDADIDALLKTYPSASIAFKEIPQTIPQTPVIVTQTTPSILQGIVNNIVPKT